VSSRQRHRFYFNGSPYQLYGLRTELNLIADRMEVPPQIGADSILRCRSLWGSFFYGPRLSPQ